MAHWNMQWPSNSKSMHNWGCATEQHVLSHHWHKIKVIESRKKVLLPKTIFLFILTFISYEQTKCSFTTVRHLLLALRCIACVQLISVCVVCTLKLRTKKKCANFILKPTAFQNKFCLLCWLHPEYNVARRVGHCSLGYTTNIQWNAPSPSWSWSSLKRAMLQQRYSVCRWPASMTTDSWHKLCFLLPRHTHPIP